MRVKCINNDNGYYELTIGKVYEVVKEDDEFYYVVDNAGIEDGFFKYRFEIVEGESKMKKYTTVEAFTELAKNPHIKFKTKALNDMDKILFINDGAITCNQGVTGHIKVYLSDEWTKVAEPVTFTEAVKSFSEGKTIRCECNDYEFIYKKNGSSMRLIDQRDSAIGYEEILEGKWFIEEEV